MGNNDKYSLQTLIKSKLPLLGPAKELVEKLDQRLGSLGLLEIKKELVEIEENANQNLDTVVEALEDLAKQMEAARKELGEKFGDFIKITHDKKLVLISSEKYAELAETTASLRVSNKQATELNKRVVKETLTNERDLKLFKEKCEELQRELTATKERESSCGLLESLQANIKADTSELDGLGSTLEALRKHIQDLQINKEQLLMQVEELKKGTLYLSSQISIVQADKENEISKVNSELKQTRFTLENAKLDLQTAEKKTLEAEVFLKTESLRSKKLADELALIRDRLVQAEAKARTVSAISSPKGNGPVIHPNHANGVDGVLHSPKSKLQ